MRVLTDEAEDHPVLGFEQYAECLVDIIKDTNPRFSIGIYGEWGTGKTTLMKLIENNLNSFVKEHTFNWQDLIEKKDAGDRFKSFLKDSYNVDWIDNSESTNENDKTLRFKDMNKTRTNDAKGSYDDKSIHSLILDLNDKKNRASLTIDGNFVRDFVVKKEKNALVLHLEQSEILTVWFNAWRYEREDQFAIIALVKTIGFAMSKHPIYKELKPILLNAVKIIGKGFLSDVASKYIGEKGVEEFKTKLLPKMEFLSELDKDTIYFDAINRIENEMHRILKENPSTRVVVFIDDLDRCSPKKALEVFESVKVFLDIDGFIFIMGLSHETIAKLIEAEYKTTEIIGEEYIRKIIQIPFLLPNWNQSDTTDIISNLLNRSRNYETRSQLDETYSEIIKDNLELISSVVEPVPREVKRFLNSFIISHKLYSNMPVGGKKEEIKPKELLLVQAIKFRWYDFYKIFSSDKKFRDRIHDLVGYYKSVPIRFINGKEEVSEEIRAIEERINNTPKNDGYEDRVRVDKDTLRDIRSFTREYKTAFTKVDTQLWWLLKEEEETIFKIQNWEIYRRATEISKDIPTLQVRKNFNDRVKTERKIGEPSAGTLRRPSLYRSKRLYSEAAHHPPSTSDDA